MTSALTTTAYTADELDVDELEQLEEAQQRRQIGYRWVVDLEDGSSLEVTTTNRDVIAWERTKARHKEWPANTEAPVFASTFIVWSAARRAGLTALLFDQFVDTVLDLTRVSDEPADPTR